VDVSLLMAALVLQNNLMIRVDGADAPAHAAFLDWLGRARRDGVPFAEQADRMPRTRPVALVSVYYRTYATRDAALAVACASPGLRRRFIDALGLADPALDGPVPDLDAHYAGLRVAAEAALASRTAAEWEAVLSARGIPASAVRLPVEILDDPQTTANAMVHRYDHQALGPVAVLGPPVALGEGGFAPGPATPPFGSEVREILTSAGFGATQIERLLAGGAVTPRLR
jgi:crotonobetainyl-CoA:carnitine CoA-transferase CaiB-like acyl-CoA transferase